MLVVCKRSGLQFEANSKRVKQHPDISGWLQQANKEGWYRDCVKVIEELAKTGTQSIEEFNHELAIVRKESLEANQKSQSEEKAFFEMIERQRKERKRINSLLRKAGYSWGKVHGDIYQIFDDSYQIELFDPQGRSTTIEEALKTLGV